MPATTAQDSIRAQLLLIRDGAASLLKETSPVFEGGAITELKKIRIAQSIKTLQRRITHIEKRFAEIES